MKRVEVQVEFEDIEFDDIDARLTDETQLSLSWTNFPHSTKHLRRLAHSRKNIPCILEVRLAGPSCTVRHSALTESEYRCRRASPHQADQMLWLLARTHGLSCELNEGH
jgi:hypothetical protein